MRLLIKHTLGLLLLAACEGSEATSTPPSRAIESGSPSDAGPELSELTTRLETMLPDLLSAGAPGAAVLILREGEVAYQRGFGLADTATQAEVGTRTAFNVGSISKLLTAWGVMKLVEQGKLDLDAPVSRYLTRWQLPESSHDPKSVTLRRVLSHTAGLSTLSGVGGFGPDIELPTIEQWLSGRNPTRQGVELEHPPGGEFRYSNGGYGLLQLLIEEASGQSFADYMRQELLAPLGMNDSDFTRTPELLPRLASCYDAAGDETPSPRSVALAAGGLHLTIDDAGRLAKAYLSTQNSPVGAGVLSPASVTSMLTAAPATRGQYGLGHKVDELPGGRRAIGHSGGNRGWHAHFVLLPDSGDGLVVLTNGDEGGRVHAEVRCEWIKWVTGGYPLEETCRGNERVAQAEVEVGPAVLESYAGVYQFAPEFHVLVTIRDGKLLMHGTGQSEVETTALSQDEFFVHEFNSRSSFQRDDTGKVIGFQSKKGGVTQSAQKLEGQVARAARESIVGPERHPIDLPIELLEGYAGRYDFESGDHIRLRVDQGKLQIKHPTAPWSPVLPESEARFFIPADPSVELSFVRDESGQVTALWVHERGHPKERARKTR